MRTGFLLMNISAIRPQSKRMIERRKLLIHMFSFTAANRSVHAFWLCYCFRFITLQSKQLFHSDRVALTCATCKGIQFSFYLFVYKLLMTMIHGEQTTNERCFGNKTSFFGLMRKFSFKLVFRFSRTLNLSRGACKENINICE